MEVRDLEPKIVWNHFEDLNAVPRPSKKEERIRKFMMDFGKNLGLETFEDAIGNVIIKKSATSGMEDKETTILQTHIDMVHQKNSDTVFDFDSQGIESYIDGDWVKANGTTLGADNGMGVAATMAVLSSNEISHPAIEALFTIDEETGMTGAKELDGTKLSGKILLNLDTEDDDEFSVGCAGGIDTNTSYQYEELIVPSGFSTLKINISGLKGGHSGMDIALGRGNSNIWMNRLLYNISREVDFNIVSVDGGSLRNAIPRESRGVIVCESTKSGAFIDAFGRFKEEILSEFGMEENQAKLEVSESEVQATKMMNSGDQKKVLAVVYTTPNNVWKMSEKMEGVVETSSSLARVIIKEGEFVTQSLQRSMIESGKNDIANALRLTYELMGAKVVQTGDYPGWAPNPNSRILEVLEREYKSMFNEDPKVAACHAGLECGILGKHLPGCDMISFGPTIRNPHSPDEKVDIGSVQKFWKFLIKVLEETPSKS